MGLKKQTVKQSHREALNTVDCWKRVNMLKSRNIYCVQIKWLDLTTNLSELHFFFTFSEDDLICKGKAGLPLKYNFSFLSLPPSRLLSSPLWTVLWPSLAFHLQEAMFDSLSAETPAWQQNGVIGLSRGISLSLSSLRGFPLWWGGWKVRFNVLWRVAAEEKLKALHAGFWVGHSSPCSEWDVPEEFAIDWPERMGIKTLLRMEM